MVVVRRKYNVVLRRLMSTAVLPSHAKLEAVKANWSLSKRFTILYYLHCSTIQNKSEWRTQVTRKHHHILNKRHYDERSLSQQLKYFHTRPVRIALHSK